MILYEKSKYIQGINKYIQGINNMEISGQKC